jgi:hypothetical protein
MTARRPSRAIFDLVFARDEGSCAYCGLGVWGERGFHFSLHHRRPAQAGGDRTVEAHSPGNLVILHGHGVSACHGLVESNRQQAVELGFLVRRPMLPAGMPIRHAVHGWCLLADDGSVLSSPTYAKEAS